MGLEVWSPSSQYHTFLRQIIFSGDKSYSKKCLKFKVPKMPKVKDVNHFYNRQYSTTLAHFTF
jgi:hypothetical protein